MYPKKDVPYTLDMSGNCSSVLKCNLDRNYVHFVDTLQDLSEHPNILNNEGFFLLYSEIVHRHSLVREMSYFTKRFRPSLKLTHSQSYKDDVIS